MIVFFQELFLFIRRRFSVFSNVSRRKVNKQKTMTSPSSCFQCFVSTEMEDRPWLSQAPLPDISGLPSFGWRVRLDHDFPVKCKPFTVPRLHQMKGMVLFSLRYCWEWIKKYKDGKKLFIDNFNLCPWRPIYGVPVGGLGCGTIGRGFRGEFCRFQLIPGMYEYNIVDANQFIVSIRRGGKLVHQQVLSPHPPPASGALSAWNWWFPSDQACYHALYPRSWTVYEIPQHGIRLVCKQVSPIIPHDYKDSSLPCAVFEWTIENSEEEEADVSIVFTFKNGQGTKADSAGGVWNEPVASKRDGCDVKGVLIHQTFKDMKCVYGVTAASKTNAAVSWCTKFDPCGSGKDIWDDLCESGQLNSNQDYSGVTKKGEESACAVCVQCNVPAKKSTTAEFCLSWDMPNVHFGSKNALYCRRYTRWFGMQGDASTKLANYAFTHYKSWEQKIDKWQKPILEADLPSWYKSALFNELYFISDGGTIWVDPFQAKNGFKRTFEEMDTPSIIQDYGKFAYLEGHEYRMYNTYDVHHYASFALIMLWPKLQLSIQYDIAKSVDTEHPQQVRYVMGGERTVAKAKDTVPHDIGDPDDEPWLKVNAYTIHPTQEWKDLNTKFVLQVYRDYISTKDFQYLQDMYPRAKSVMEASLRWDTDDDGLIDNAGFADQTYDAWIVTGASAYCGGLWLAALKVMCEMAKLLGCVKDEEKFSSILRRGRDSYEKKLWNGKYYNYDCSESTYHDSIQADQLAGHWYLKATGIPDNKVFPEKHVKSALSTVFQHNVMSFNKGTMGAINGMRPDGQKDTTSIQSEEFWTGVTYAVAANMLQEGMMSEGWQTAYGSYHTVYESFGLGFQTPEAYYDDGRFRSLGYMRPLSIWSMQHALSKFHPNLLKQ